MVYRTWIALSLAVLAAAFAEAPARACEPPSPELYSTIPEDGSTYPGNAAVMFNGYDISLEGVTVTVDGQPASFGPAPTAVSFYDVSWDIMATILPMPLPGQKVVIEGNFCALNGECQEKLTFTAGPPDTQAPPTLNATSFDVYDYTDYETKDCRFPSDYKSELAYWVDVQAEPPTPEPGDSAWFYVIEAFHPATPDKVAIYHTGSAGDGTLRAELRPSTWGLDGAAAADLCFRVISFDAAGNVTEAKSSVCKACRYRADEPEVSHNSEPSEPMWTSADIYPGGPCDVDTSSGSSGSSSSGSTGSGGTDKGEIEFGGCGCQVGSDAPASGPWSAALALSAFVFARTRRRSVRR